MFIFYINLKRDAIEAIDGNKLDRISCTLGWQK